MKTTGFLKTAVLSAVLLVSSITVCARNYDNNLIYNSEEENGMLVGQTVYKMEGSSLANYMKYNYKYDTNKRMIESQTMKWNSYKNNWEMICSFAIHTKAKLLLQTIINGITGNKNLYWLRK